MKFSKIFPFVLFLVLIRVPVSAQGNTFYPIDPVLFTEVTLHDQFWQDRINTNAEVTIPFAFNKSEETGRIENFRVAGGLTEGTFNTGRGYDDSDVYKIIEGASYSLITHPDPDLEAYLDTLVDYIAAAQEEDGYLYTVRTIMGDSSHTGKRFDRDVNWGRWNGIEQGSHELYDLGHLYEAAVAHYEATGKRSLLDVAIKSADLVDQVFGKGKREMVPGHQEIEIGLVKLYTVTGEKRYLDLAKFFLDYRGRTRTRLEYNQTHQPVVDQEEAVGHAVRAIYMFAGMADIAALTGNEDYLMAMEKLWYDILKYKLYITGGIGSPGGAEGFAMRYALDNLTAYCETCAAIANVFWNYRMFLDHGDSKYIDVMELALYNNVLSGVSLSGDRFFYPNRLESRGDITRSEWFSTSCCPTNITRLIPSVPGYIYAHTDDRIYLNLFISSSAEFSINGTPVALDQVSSLPWAGEVKLQVDPRQETTFPLYIRIPSWTGDRPVDSDLYSYADEAAGKPRISVNGNPVRYVTEKGYAVVDRTWNKGDRVSISFPFHIRKIVSNEQVRNNRGRIAYQAGPVIYCTEGIDYPSGKATNLLMNDDSLHLVYQKDLLDGVMTLRGRARQLTETPGGNVEPADVTFTGIPYYGWANRGASEMLVWVPVREEYAVPDPYPTIASTSEVATSKTIRTVNLGAVNDLYLPGPDVYATVTEFNMWPLHDTTAWISYTFLQPDTVSGSTVYWFADTNRDVTYPESWKIYYRKNGTWKPVRKPEYVMKENGEPSTVRFKQVVTDAMKLEFVMGEKPAGLYEWIVK